MLFLSAQIHMRFADDESCVETEAGATGEARTYKGNCFLTVCSRHYFLLASLTVSILVLLFHTPPPPCYEQVCVMFFLFLSNSLCLTPSPILSSLVHPSPRHHLDHCVNPP